MEPFNILEHKLAQLLIVVKDLREKNSALTADNMRLHQENSDLAKKIEALETSVLQSTSSNEEEKALTKMMVDDLIKSIDALVGNEIPS